ncbi:amidohydrolase [Actinopolyspora erythraea]|uniref:Amidohydrolase n=1 Tax=Actinopolyspora erythraea TaxID=414996 RepID=A0A099D838_9ACTN|nr:amidohydrolase [Actinopolyspora erythraea]ASU78338.1 amidohydrolase [Actinopolyspora erythraea]KGI81972.1 amidohydrolase [Actinopolyspora erythraea]
MPERPSSTADPLENGLSGFLPRVVETYRDLHAHPELAFTEHRTAATVASELRAVGGWEVTEGVGGTGVVAVLRNGDGPVVWLRADMDALPLREETGLPYASVEPGRMHACGHDVHTACLLGACRQFAANPGAWRGTVVAVFQPAEEIGRGARAMLDDGILRRFPAPTVSLGQHVGPLPAGVVITRPGTLMAAAESLRVRLHGKGGHASTPRFAVDPVVLAATVVLRLQAFSAQHAGEWPPRVLTVGALHAGTVANIIPEEAELLLSLRTFTSRAHEEMVEAVRRIVVAEAEASGAPKPPEIERYNRFDPTVNTEGTTERVINALHEAGSLVRTLSDPLNGSEDFGGFATEAGCPSVFWHFGGAAPSRFSERDLELLAAGELPPGTVSNHSPSYAPDPEEAILQGIRNLLVAGREWLRPDTTRG